MIEQCIVPQFQRLIAEADKRIKDLTEMRDHFQRIIKSEVPVWYVVTVRNFSSSDDKVLEFTGNDLVAILALADTEVFKVLERDCVPSWSITVFFPYKNNPGFAYHVSMDEAEVREMMPDFAPVQVETV